MGCKRRQANFCHSARFPAHRRASPQHPQQRRRLRSLTGKVPWLSDHLLYGDTCKLSRVAGADGIEILGPVERGYLPLACIRLMRRKRNNNSGSDGKRGELVYVLYVERVEFQLISEMVSFL